MIKISQITDNIGNTRWVFENLKVGDKLRAKCKVTSKGDIGMSGFTFHYDAFIPNKVYKVNSTLFWDHTKIGYVSDEGGTLHFATPDLFDIVES